MIHFSWHKEKRVTGSNLRKIRKSLRRIKLSIFAKCTLHPLNMCSVSIRLIFMQTSKVSQYLESARANSAFDCPSFHLRSHLSVKSNDCCERDHSCFSSLFWGIHFYSDLLLCIFISWSYRSNLAGIISSWKGSSSLFRAQLDAVMPLLKVILWQLAWRWAVFDLPILFFSIYLLTLPTPQSWPSQLSIFPRSISSTCYHLSSESSNTVNFPPLPVYNRPQDLGISRLEINPIIYVKFINISSGLIHYLSQECCIQTRIPQWDYFLITKSQASLSNVEDYATQKAKTPKR